MNKRPHQSKTAATAAGQSGYTVAAVPNAEFNFDKADLEDSTQFQFHLEGDHFGLGIYVNEDDRGLGTPLSVGEGQALLTCEATIANGKNAFLAVGAALHQIQRHKLYREHFPSFNLYCQEKWGFSANYAYRLIKAKEVAEEVLPIGNGGASPSEAVLREVGQAPKARRQEVYARAKARAGEAEPTAKTVRETVDEVNGVTAAPRARKRKGERAGDTPAVFANISEFPPGQARTPLTTVRTWVEEARERISTGDKERALTLLDQIHQALVPYTELEPAVTQEAV